MQFNSNLDTGKPASLNTNAITKVSLRGVKRRSNLKIRNEIATLLLVARNDNVITFNAFVSVQKQSLHQPG